MKKPKRIVGGHEERFARPATYLRLITQYPGLEALARPKAEDPIWRHKQGIAGITVPSNELGKRGKADAKACESLRDWFKLHVIEELGINTWEIMIVVEWDLEDPDCDEDGSVIRFYKTCFPPNPEKGIVER
jgi:hypothetical protein